MLDFSFFNRDAVIVAKELLGKVMRVKYNAVWLSAMIIETEAYYLHDKSSHASLGFTEKRRGLFMPAGTIYMYYARGADSMNVSVKGEGNAVLIKSGIPFIDDATTDNMIHIMQQLNPKKNSHEPRPQNYLCSGQTLLCRSLNLRVKEWDQQQFDRDRFFIEDIDGYVPEKIIQTKRLGIPKGRDEHLEYRFVDARYAAFCTQNPLKNRAAVEDFTEKNTLKTEEII